MIVSNVVYYICFYNHLYSPIIVASEWRKTLTKAELVSSSRLRFLHGTSFSGCVFLVLYFHSVGRRVNRARKKEKTR